MASAAAPLDLFQLPLADRLEHELQEARCQVLHQEEQSERQRVEIAGLQRQVEALTVSRDKACENCRSLDEVVVQLQTSFIDHLKNLGDKVATSDSEMDASLSEQHRLIHQSVAAHRRQSQGLRGSLLGRDPAYIRPHDLPSIGHELLGRLEAMESRRAHAVADWKERCAAAAAGQERSEGRLADAARRCEELEAGLRAKSAALESLRHVHEQQGREWRLEAEEWHEQCVVASKSQGRAEGRLAFEARQCDELTSQLQSLSEEKVQTQHAQELLLSEMQEEVRLEALLCRQAEERAAAKEVADAQELFASRLSESEAEQEPRALGTYTSSLPLAPKRAGSGSAYDQCLRAWDAIFSGDAPSVKEEATREGAQPAHGLAELDGRDAHWRAIRSSAFERAPRRGPEDISSSTSRGPSLASNQRGEASLDQALDTLDDLLQGRASMPQAEDVHIVELEDQRARASRMPARPVLSPDDQF